MYPEYLPARGASLDESKDVSMASDIARGDGFFG